MKQHIGLKLSQAVLNMLPARFENASVEAYANNREQGNVLVPTRSRMKVVIANWRENPEQIVIYSGDKKDFDPQNIPSEQVFANRVILDNPIDAANHIASIVA